MKTNTHSRQPTRRRAQTPFLGLQGRPAARELGLGCLEPGEGWRASSRGWGVLGQRRRACSLGRKAAKLGVGGWRREESGSTSRPALTPCPTPGGRTPQNPRGLNQHDAILPAEGQDYAVLTPQFTDEDTGSGTSGGGGFAPRKADLLTYCTALSSSKG